MKYLCNAFSINMIPLSGATVKFEPCSLDCARMMVSSEEFISAIGHAETMALVNNQLGTSFEANRVSLSLNPGDFLLVAQYIGPRLPEGATQLPEGAEIRYFTVDVK